MGVSLALVVMMATGLVAAPPASAVPTAVGLSVNGDFGCALMPTHGVECWGYNFYGQLGNGTTTNSLTPVRVLGITHAVAVAAGTFHACALLSTGRVKCWGRNTHGELGNRSTVDSHVPVYVMGITHVTRVTADYSQTCALLSTGGAKCWGFNAHGELGDGTTTDRHAPVQVIGLLSHVTWISAGEEHTCAVQLGVAKCWGLNGNGQLGDGTVLDRYRPRKVSGLSAHTAILNAGTAETCALERTPSRGNALYCWGYNSNGQLGDGTTTERHVPVAVSGMGSHVTSVSLGDDSYACAVQLGAAKCWGKNEFGQLGDGTITDHSRARQVVGLESGVVKISSAWYASCVLLITHRVKCWGYDAVGELGNNSTTQSNVPVFVHLI